jgi:hypothetical protein
VYEALGDIGRLQVSRGLRREDHGDRGHGLRASGGGRSAGGGGDAGSGRRLGWG